MTIEMDALAIRIRQSLLDLDRVVERAKFLLDRAQIKQDDGYLDGVALNLHGFYAGLERIFEDIARTMEQSVPDSLEWHRDLLLQMADDIKAVRPAVIQLETRRCLDEYRGFRHVVRNVYAFTLRPARLKELTDDLSTCYQAVKNDLTMFIAFLEELST